MIKEQWIKMKPTGLGAPSVHILMNMKPTEVS